MDIPLGMPIFENDSLMTSPASPPAGWSGRVPSEWRANVCRQSLSVRV